MMLKRVALVVWLIPLVAGAEDAPPPQQPAQQQQQQPPPQQQQPYPYGYQPQQQYPYGYQPPQQYPYGYQPPQQQPQPPYPRNEPQPYGLPASPPVRLPRLALPARNEAAVTATWACADALDHLRPDVARIRCGEALAKDDAIAFTHLLLSMAQAPELARNELGRALELERYASNGERLFIEAWRAQVDGRLADARRLHDQLVQALPGEPRAFVQHGRFHQLVLGDLDGAVADFHHAAELDPKYAASYGYLAGALAERGQLDDALQAAKKYLELAPGEPAAHLSIARTALRRGELSDAIAAAKKAAAGDEKFAQAHATLGDALLFSGRGKDARKEYGLLIGTDDPAVHHQGSMREARSWIFEGRQGEAEKSLAAEADLAQKTKRPGDEADARVELGRVQLDRGAVSEAGQMVRQAFEVLQNKDLQPSMSDDERRRLTGEALQVRAMVLAAVGERALAEQRADEMGLALRIAGDPRAAEKTTALRGWIAARNRDDKTALVDLAVASRPTLRMALALAATRSGDPARAKTIMEELSKRAENDLEGALTRPRAIAWLKTQK